MAAVINLPLFILAGVKGRINGLVGSYIDYDMYGVPKSNVWFYEMEVTEILSQWPESSFRQRKWVGYFFFFS